MKASGISLRWSRRNARLMGPQRSTKAKLRFRSGEVPASLAQVVKQYLLLLGIGVLALVGVVAVLEKRSCGRRTQITILPMFGEMANDHVVSSQDTVSGKLPKEKRSVVARRDAVEQVGPASEVMRQYQAQRGNLFFDIDNFIGQVVRDEPHFARRAGAALLETTALKRLDPQWHIRAQMPGELLERMAILDLLEAMGRSPQVEASVRAMARASLAAIAARPSGGEAFGVARLEAAESYDALSALGRLDADHAKEIYARLPARRRKTLFAAMVTGLSDSGVPHQDAVNAALKLMEDDSIEAQ